MKIKSPGVIAFIATCALVLGATALNANPNKDRTHRAALDIVANHFKPSVVEPTTKPVGDPIGEGFTAEFIPVQSEKDYVVDVVIRRDANAPRAATARLKVNCSVETFNQMSRVPRPVQVNVGSQQVVATLAPGQELTKRVTFKAKGGQPLGGTARLTVTTLGGEVVRNDIVLASATTINRRAPSRMELILE